MALEKKKSTIRKGPAETPEEEEAADTLAAEPEAPQPTAQAARADKHPPQATAPGTVHH